MLVPKTGKEATQIDKANSDTRWWNAILQEMNNARPAFDIFDGNKEYLPIRFQMNKYHFIFNVKLWKNFRQKTRLVGGGNMIGNA